ncbi:ExeM/NucH family extracellular endonuclease [Nigerium massiliense]|uniref:ExeM/NucH family extracellular endonuclease n=1 Tax=Nigerium massiliense TaxID=1522317 RepID=UPI00090774E5|nr:ExeM/NucH family extracellular endonuclease [Nigerium massiliense]
MPPASTTRRAFAVLSAVACTAASLIAVAPTAHAAADHIVINEFYGRGGSANQPFANKFVELYNPTGADVALAGTSLQYRSATGTGNASGVAALTGTVKAGGYFLVQLGSNGTTGAALPAPDQTATGINPSGTTGTVYLAKAATAINPDTTASVIDKLGYGTSNSPETAAAAYDGSNTTPGSLNRANGADTDNNAADFSFSAPVTPQNSSSAGGPVDPDPTPTPEPGASKSIAEIQGTGSATPLAGQSVTTRGVITAAYPTGGFRGVYIQTPGSGGTAKTAGQASDGIFVFSDTLAAMPIGTCIDVSGTATEYYDLTQLTNVTATPQTGCAAVKPTPLATLPATDADKEAYEGMLVQPEGTYTITNNYQANQYGQIGLAVGTKPLYQATDVVAPGAAAAAYEAENVKKYITLDDGSSWNYLTNKTAQDSPLPYLSATTPMRTASQVTFTKPVILDYRFQWNYQPTGQVVGSDSPNIPVASENDREATVPAVGGDVQLASFNVLNYFSDLGENESGCRAYADRNGNPVATNNCQVRGAYTAKAFADQKAKIVSAINGTNAEVVSLMEIENSAGISYLPGQNRDKALADLVAGLNAAAGTTRWAYVPSPTAVPTSEDVIRTAFIYDPSKVQPVGPSLIDVDTAFANARYPLAQKFSVTGSGTQFVVVANHFKSKGSGADDGTGQGLSNPSREAQARQLTSWVGQQFADEAVFLMGDFNSYSAETPVRIIESAGFTNLAKKFDEGSASYQFSGRLGSLDHAFANAKALALVTGASVWDINGDESVAFQYSRRNYNVVDFYAPNAFASSDHDPVVVGVKAAAATSPVAVKATASDCNSFGFAVEGTVPAGARLKVTWERDGQGQTTTVTNFPWWSGNNQAGWSNAKATLVAADGTVLATSGAPINPQSCPVISSYGVTKNAFGFKVTGAVPEGARLRITWTRSGQKQTTTVSAMNWWSGANQAGWSGASAVLIDAKGDVVAKSALINPPA